MKIQNENARKCMPNFEGGEREEPSKNQRQWCVNLLGNGEKIRNHYSRTQGQEELEKGMQNDTRMKGQ